MNNLKRAVDSELSGLYTSGADRAQIVECAMTRGRSRRKKASALVLVCALLLLLAVTAVAVAWLSEQEMVEEMIVPMAQANDTDGPNERFTNEELRQIVDAAEQSGFTIPDRLVQAAENGLGDYEEETIMSLAREAFGGLYYEWTIEQKHWFGEVMIAIGFRDFNSDCLPGEGDIPYEEALRIAVERIKAETGDDVLDASLFKLSADFTCVYDDDGAALPPEWGIYFDPTDARHNAYWVTLSAQGDILSLKIDAALDEDSSAGDVIDKYNIAYGSYAQWSCETWAALSADIAGRDPGNRRGWAFQHAGYRMPPEGGLSEERIREIALAAVNLEYTTVDAVICCTDGDTPIWKVETHTDRPEDAGSGLHSAIWLLEIDAMTGDVREKREFIVGPGSEPMTRWVPFHVYENLPPMPEAPNG